MEQFRQRMNDRIKTSLQASDEEWAVIQPLLNKVQDKMRETMLGRFNLGPRPQRAGNNGGGNNGAGGNGGDNAPRPERADRQNNRPEQAGSAESQALRTALESPSTSNTEIKQKLEALRESRKKANAELEQAREELKSVLSLHQEATLVMMGMLD
jgi:hypothetical protein